FPNSINDIPFFPTYQKSVISDNKSRSCLTGNIIRTVAVVYFEISQRFPLIPIEGVKIFRILIVVNTTAYIIFVTNDESKSIFTLILKGGTYLCPRVVCGIVFIEIFKSFILFVSS